MFLTLCLIALAPITAEAGQNILPNPGYDTGLTAWSRPWARSPGGASSAWEKQVGHDAAGALKIEARAKDDWSVSQEGSVSAQVGEVYGFSAWVRDCKGGKGSPAESRLYLSCVSRSAASEVLDWEYGRQETGPRGQWVKLEGRIIVPAGCKSLQLRLTGRGKASWLVDDVDFRLVKPAAPAQGLDRPLSISGGGSSLFLDPASKNITLRDTKNGAEYRFDATSLLARAESARLDSPSKITLALRDAWADEASAALELTDSGQALLSLTGTPGARLDANVEFPGSLAPEPGWSWVLPVNEGLLIPDTDPHFSTWELELYGGHGLCMPFFGLTNGQAGLAVIAETQDDALARFTPPGNSSVSRFSILFQPSRQTWRYPRSVRLIPTAGGYVGVAKAYREYARTVGKLVTLKEKQKTVPQLDKLAGAVNLWYWKKVETWEQDDGQAVKIAQELKAAGVDKVLWSHEQGPETVKALNGLGFLTGRYDIYQDIWGPDNPHPWVYKEGWPDDIVLLPDGSPMRGWVDRDASGKEYAGGVISSARSVELIKKRVPIDLATHPYGARFLDTTTASPLREDYNPLHPLSRSDDRANKAALLSYLSRDLRLVTGSETGMDLAVPYLHYFEGMMSLGPYRLPDSGYDLGSPRTPQPDFLRFQIGSQYRIPLFELVYHDCVMDSWYWGDAANRLVEYLPERDLLNALYGTMPLWILDPQRWAEQKKALVASYKNATAVSRQTAYSELLEHRFLSEDRNLQYSRFEAAEGAKGPVEVWGNFDRLMSRNVMLETGEIITLPPRSFAVRNGDGGWYRSGR
jgi:hypothetical protein